MSLKLCELCAETGGLLIVKTTRWRIVRVDDAEFPAYYRLIWNRHVAEFSELNGVERHACMDAVATIEATMRSLLNPTKVNLASLGNAVPHLHWHVVARFDWDSRFPRPIWGEALRRRAEPSAAERLPQARLAAVDDALRAVFGGLCPASDS